MLGEELFKKLALSQTFLNILILLSQDVGHRIREVFVYEGYQLKVLWNWLFAWIIVFIAIVAIIYDVLDLKGKCFYKTPELLTFYNRLSSLHNVNDAVGLVVGIAHIGNKFGVVLDLFYGLYTIIVKD